MRYCDHSIDNHSWELGKAWDQRTKGGYHLREFLRIWNSETSAFAALYSINNSKPWYIVIVNVLTGEKKDMKIIHSCEEISKSESHYLLLLQYLKTWGQSTHKLGTLDLAIGTSLQLSLEASTSEPRCADSVLCNESLWQLEWLPKFASEVVQLHFPNPVFKDLSWHCNFFLTFPEAQ